jgi:hypothetical protein
MTRGSLRPPGPCCQAEAAGVEAIARGEGLAAFAASEALERWDEGSWALDPA